jgi:hypothetical protein
VPCCGSSFCTYIFSSAIKKGEAEGGEKYSVRRPNSFQKAEKTPGEDCRHKEEERKSGTVAEGEKQFLVLVLSMPD